MEEARRKTIEELLSNPFFNISSVSDKALLLYDQSLTHRSYAKEMQDKNIDCLDNERLEFFGNFVLGFVVSEFLFKNFNYSEGKMTKRMEVVSDAFLAKVIKKKDIGLDKNTILLGKGRSGQGKKLEVSIIASAFEALIGAIYLDQGMAKARKIILELLADEVEHFDPGRNYIGRLQELVQKNKLGELKYLEKRLEGPDHRPTFKAIVVISGNKYGAGKGSSKKAAKMVAAKAALKKLKKM